jgi:hypothetical protein
MKKYFTLLTIVFALILSESSLSQTHCTFKCDDFLPTIDGKMPDASTPVKVISFDGSINNDKVTLQWTIDENESTDRFELEKSIDGVNFNLAALVFTSEKTGNENYMFYERFKKSNPVYYRLKIFTKTQDINYSKILRIPN